MKVAIIYDCLFPWTIGGAERWCRNLAERFAEKGHTVTYLTLRQWDKGAEPDIPGVKIVAVGPRMALYKDGKRRIWPPLRFGIGVFWHLLRHPSRYARLHLASFPFFALLAAGILRPLGGYRISVEWHEVWSRQYWDRYLGWLGWVGWSVQKLCAHIPQTAYSFSRLHLERLQALGVAGPSEQLTGEYAGGALEPRPARNPPVVVYAGRMIPEKRVLLLIDALQLVRSRNAEVQAFLFGDGPDRQRAESRATQLGLSGKVHFPGFVSSKSLDEAMRTATILVQPSEREGYGMVVVESAARGVPVVLVEGEDNAATELIDEGKNGFVAPANAEGLADTILAAILGGKALRESTREWYSVNAERLSIDNSLEKLAANIIGPDTEFNQAPSKQ